MRFLVDMGISMETVVFLRGLGHTAVHLREQGLQKMADPEILVKARAEQRILVAHDLDFGDLLAASGAPLPSVVMFRLRDMRPRNVNRHLAAVITQHGTLLQEGVVVSVTEGRMRVRTLPLERR